MESVRTFAQTNRQIAQMSEVSILLSGYQKDVQTLIRTGIPIEMGIIRAFLRYSYKAYLVSFQWSN